MGQKVNPIGFRLGTGYKSCKSNWYANKRNYAAQLWADIKIREFLFKKLEHASLSSVEIERTAQMIDIIINTARPGIVIGRKGDEIDNLKKQLANMLMLQTSQISIKIAEVKKPSVDALLVANNISHILAKRGSYKRAMKKQIREIMRVDEAKGVKIQISGRLNGAEIARREWAKEGSIPLHTLRADIDYAESTSLTTYGILGVKVWIYKGEIATDNGKAIADSGDRKG